MLLVDFPNDVIESVSRDIEVATAKTRWNEAEAPPIPYEDHSLVFFYATYRDQVSAGLHTMDQTRVRSLLERGGLIVYFISAQCQRFHVTNVLGDLRWLQLTGGPLQPAQAIIPIQIDPYQSLFSSYSHRIVQTIGLFNIPTQDVPGAEENCKQLGLTAIAFYRTGGGLQPVSLVLRFQSGGGVIFLPVFANEVLPRTVTLVPDEIVPSDFPHLYEPATQTWLEDTRYQMPRVLELIGERRTVAKEYENRLRQIDQEISRIKSLEQEPFSQLLLSSGDALKKAVANALTYIGLFVVDVDEYWAQSAPKREKEEDLWTARVRPTSRCLLHC